MAADLTHAADALQNVSSCGCEDILRASLSCSFLPTLRPYDPGLGPTTIGIRIQLITLLRSLSRLPLVGTTRRQALSISTATAAAVSETIWACLASLWPRYQRRARRDALVCTGPL